MKFSMMLLCSLLMFSASAKPIPAKVLPHATMVELTGKLDGATAFLKLSVTLKVAEASLIPLMRGNFSGLSDARISSSANSFWRFSPRGELLMKNDWLMLRCHGAGTYTVEYPFTAKVSMAGQRRSLNLQIIPMVIGQARLELAEKNINPELSGAIQKASEEGVFEAAFSSSEIKLSWENVLSENPQSGMLSYDITSVVSVQAGSVKIFTKLIGEVHQGKPQELKFTMPRGVNILSISGDKLKSWDIDTKSGILRAKLSETFDGRVELTVNAEKALAKIPCEFELEPLLPIGAMRVNGRLTVGSGPGLKADIIATSGVIQTGAPVMTSSSIKTPARPLFYTFTDNYQIKIEASNITPSYNAETTCIYNVQSNALQVRMDCVLEVRDAPLKELEVNFSEALTFSQVVSTHIRSQNYDIRKVDGKPRVRLQFTPEASGTVPFTLYFERELKNESSFTAAPFEIIGARSLRGTLILAAERGLLLQTEPPSGLIPIHPGTLPRRHAGLQAAFLFKTPEVETVVKIAEEQRHITGEYFHLISAGEGTAYGSTLFSLHIAGAPAGKLRFLVDKNLNNLDFRGRNLSTRRQVGKSSDGFNIWEVEFSKRQLGDITLLAVYEIPLSNKEAIRLGAITIPDVGNAAGWIALTGLPGMKVKNLEAAPETAPVDSTELPVEYHNMLANQLLAVYRSSGKKQWQDVKISSFDKDPLPDTVIDWSELKTRIDNNGASITEVSYRVKNSTAQFLSLQLPSGSELWNVRIDKKRLRLSLDGDNLMIPLPRHHNINSPIQIDLSYAAQLPPLGDSWDMKLSAPAVKAKVMTSKWRVQVPETCVVVKSEPHFGENRDIFRGGASGLIERIARGVITLWPLMLMALGVTAAGCLMIFGILRKHWLLMIFATLMAVICLAGAYASQNYMRQFFRSRSLATNQVTFTDLARFSETPHTIKLEIDNMEMTNFNGFAGVTITAGLVVLITAFLTKKRTSKTIWIALTGIGIALLFTGLSQWYKLGILLSVALVLMLPVIIAIGIWVWLWRKLRAGKAVLILLALSALPIMVSAQAKVSSFQIDCEANDKSMRVVAKYYFEVEESGSMIIAGAETEYQKIIIPDSGNLIKTAKGWEISFTEPGKFRVKLDAMIPLKAGAGAIKSFNIYAPPSTRGIVSVNAGAGMKLRARDAIQINSSKSGVFTIHPKAAGQNIYAELIPARDTDIAPNFSAGTTMELNSGRGALELTGTVVLTIPQGSIKVFNITIPGNMQIAKVEARGLETWLFKPSTHNLSVHFQEPQTGSTIITVRAQIPVKSLPQEVTIKNFIISGASHQHGTLGIYANADIHVTEIATTGFTMINNSYFKSAQRRTGETIRAYRYSGSEAELALKIAEVTPEIRVNENVQIDFEDERTVLSSQLKLDIIKGGIFALELIIPEGMEINTISGKDIQHWNEIRRNQENRAVINFKKRISGTTVIKCELFKIASKSYKEEAVPSLIVKGVEKHRGTLSISAAKGTAMTVLKRNGIAVSRDIAIIPRGGSRLQFRIQQPGWSLRLGFEETPPWIQAQLLQAVKIRQNAVTCETTIIYAIENNGIRQLNLELPPEFVNPEFDGRFIIAVNKIEGNHWRIELDRKIEHHYRLKINNRLSTTEKNQTLLRPIKILDSGVQTGYIAVFPEDSLALKPAVIRGEVTAQNPRSIPNKFGDRNLSEAVAAFRTVGQQWSTTLITRQNEAVKLLKASISSLNISTLVTATGETITDVNARVKNFGENFLEFELPAGADILGSRVESIPVETVKSESKFMIPLPRGIDTMREQTVNFTYSQSRKSLEDAPEQTFTGPAFKLPLKNISWKLYLPNAFTYSQLDGNLDFQSGLLRDFGVSSLAAYDSLVSNKIAQKGGKIKEYMASGKSYVKKGLNQAASQMMQNAIDISDNESLRKDLQGQLLGYNREWNFKNIAKRRNTLARSRSRQATPEKDKNLEEQIRQQQGDDEVTALRQIADRIFTQQQAAYSTPQLFDIEIPWRGKQLTFERALEPGTGKALSIKLKASKKYRYDPSSWLAFSALAILFALIAALFAPPAKQHQ